MRLFLLAIMLVTLPGCTYYYVKDTNGQVQKYSPQQLPDFNFLPPQFDLGDQVYVKDADRIGIIVAMSPHQFTDGTQAEG